MTAPVRQPLPAAPDAPGFEGLRLVPAGVPSHIASSPSRRRSLLPPLASSLLVIAAWLAAVPQLRPLGDMMPGARLHLSAAYLVLAPYCDVMDALTLLSVRQHVALLATIVALYAAWRWRRRARYEKSGALVECVRGATLLAVVVAVYTIGALEQRPMAALALTDVNSLAVDFHSHTDASWDGRRGFSAEDNRTWHRDAGFDVSYISDHGTIAAAMAGMSRNPRRAGYGTLVLPAAEVRCEGQHVVILGATARDTAADCGPRTLPSALGGHAAYADERVALLTIPGNLAHSGRPLPAVQGLEVADGAPRGMEQMARDGRVMQHIVDSAGLARVSGSNNHGWGRTASAWSVLTIAGWRTMSPESLDVAIRRDLLHTPGTAVRVVERRRAIPASSPLGLFVTAPVAAWTMLTALSPAERLSWMCWIWAAWACVAIRRASRAVARADSRRLVRARAA